MNVIVTGATGFLGKKLVQYLLGKGCNITVIIRNKESIVKQWKDKIRWIIYTNNINEQYNMFQDNEEIDIFFHFAWVGTSGSLRSDACVQIDNIKLACDALQLAHRLNCKRFIYAGSIMEYEVNKYMQETEINPSLNMLYSVAKLSADYMCNIMACNFGMTYINLVISNIYGENEQSARFLNNLIRRLVANESIDLTEGNQLYDFIYITDAIRAIMLVAEKGESGNYYIGNQTQKTLKEFVLRAKEISNSNSKLNFGAIRYDNAYLDYSEINVSRIYEELGFETEISFETGINILLNEVKDKYKDE